MYRDPAAERAELLQELDRIEVALVPPWAHGPAADAWREQFAQLTPPQNGAPPMTNFKLIEGVTNHPQWGPEYVRRLEQRKAMSGTLTPQMMEDAAREIIFEHPDEVVQAINVSQGHAADLSGLSPAQLAKLQEARVSQEDIIAAAQFTNPDVSRPEAIRRWTEKARKAAAPNAEGAFYIPGKSVAEESDV